MCPDLSCALRGIVNNKLSTVEAEYNIGKKKSVLDTCHLIILFSYITDNKSTQSCIPALRMQLTTLQKADLASFADGLWVSCGIILNYIGSQPLVLKRCSELRVVICLDHSVRKQALKLKQLLWRAAAKGPAEQVASSTWKTAVLPLMHYEGGLATLWWAVEHFALKVGD